jgi:hypothetical protein
MHKDWDMCLKLFGCLQWLLECHKICGITCFKCTWLIAWQITTVGYGDITPNSNWGRLIVICVILGAVIILPVQINRILQLASRRCSSLHLHSLTLIGCTPLTIIYTEIPHNMFFVLQERPLESSLPVVSYIERISRGESGEWICFVFLCRPFGGRFTVRKVVGSRFIIISGNLTYRTVQDFLSEFYHPIHNQGFFCLLFFFFGFHPLLRKFSVIWHK